MNVWLVNADYTKYQSLVLVHGNDARILLSFEGVPLAHSWMPLQVTLEPDEKSIGDFLYLSSLTIAASEHATQVLSPLIVGSAEVLPLQCEAAQFYAINVIEVVDCLDHSQSEVVWFKDGSLAGIKRHIFKPRCLERKHIFKIPERKRSFVFVSDAFKQLIEDHQLTGLVFEKVWEG